MAPLSFGFLWLIVFLWSPSLPAGVEADLEYISPAELAARLGSPDLVIIDVSPPSVYTTYSRKIKGARRELPGQASDWGRQYSPEQTLVLYCRCQEEFASRQVAAVLKFQGRSRVLVLKGGWEAWVQGGYPTEPK